MVQLLILVLLIGVNAFFAATEIALISLNDNKIKVMAEDGHVKAKKVLKLLSKPTQFLSTIQIGITVAGFMASAYASDSYSEPLVKWISGINPSIDGALLKTMTIVLITLILAFVSLVLGELVPKRVAMKHAEAIAFSVVGILGFVAFIFKPFVGLLTFTTNLIVRLFGVDPNQEDDQITEEEIRMMVDVGEEKGTIRETEKEMINNIFEFDNMQVEDIMTHRTDIAGLPLDATLDEVKLQVFTEQYTRFPVYQDEIDNIVGILHVKDLIHAFSVAHPAEFDLKNFIREPYFVPESMRTDELFRELQKRKVHIAVVIDEYGGTAGIITIEDLIEEIVGNIFDEYDEEEKEFVEISENIYVVSGAITLDELEDHCEIGLPIEEYDTLSGFMVGQLGHIPEDKESSEIEFNHTLFKILEVEEKVIKRVQVTRLIKEEQSN